jgi:hydroxymethylbilane synthase
LKDLPTELPDGLKLGAVTKREDPRDVLVTCGKVSSIKGLPEGAVVASSSPRRQAQIRQLRPDLKLVEIRGNVGTRLRKLSEQPELHATMLAAAGMKRLGYSISDEGKLEGPDVPDNIFVVPFEVTEMIPAVGQAAIGLEIRENDSAIQEIMDRLNHAETWHCIRAERAFLNAMGGGCQSPVAAYAEISGDKIEMRAVSFRDGPAKRAAGKRPIKEATELGEQLAAALK